MRGKLPPTILNRKKIGFDIPAHDWLRGPLRPLLDEAVAFASAEHGDFFHIPKIEAHRARPIWSGAPILAIIFGD